MDAPFTVDDFLRAGSQAFIRPENLPQKRGKPRVSSLCRDARAIAYMMANTPETNPHQNGRIDSEITAEQGRRAEQLSIDIIKKLNYGVDHRQVELPDDYPVTGHPDGQLFSAIEVDWDYMPDGLTWGFEHKMYGRWAYEDVLKLGIEASAPDVIAQASLYGHAWGGMPVYSSSSLKMLRRCGLI